jgi:ubiquinone/menaquinone biosynthesis C-methylase UbiE
MPWAASRLSGDPTGAYRYLPRSVVSFLSADEMRDRLTNAGFNRVSTRPMTLGVVTLYRAARS